MLVDFCTSYRLNDFMVMEGLIQINEEEKYIKLYK